MNRSNPVKVRKGPEFDFDGTWIVTAPDGSTGRMYFDRQSGCWWECDVGYGSKNYGEGLLGNTKAEAVEELLKSMVRRQYAARKNPAKTIACTDCRAGRCGPRKTGKPMLRCADCGIEACGHKLRPQPLPGQEGKIGWCMNCLIARDQRRRRTNPAKKPICRGQIMHLIDENALEIILIPLEGETELHEPSGLQYVQMPDNWSMKDLDDAVKFLMKQAKKHGILLHTYADGYPTVEEG